MTQCPHCSEKFKINNTELPPAGKLIQCPHCLRRFVALKPSQFYRDNFPKEIAEYIIYRKENNQTSNIGFDLERIQNLADFHKKTAKNPEQPLSQATPEALFKFMGEMEKRHNALQIEGLITTLLDFFDIQIKLKHTTDNPLVHYPPLSELLTPSAFPEEILTYLHYREKNDAVSEVKFSAKWLKALNKFLDHHQETLTNAQTGHIEHFFELASHKLHEEDLEHLKEITYDFFESLQQHGKITQNPVEKASMNRWDKQSPYPNDHEPDEYDDDFVEPYHDPPSGQGKRILLRLLIVVILLGLATGVAYIFTKKKHNIPLTAEDLLKRATEENKNNEAWSPVPSQPKPTHTSKEITSLEPDPQANTTQSLLKNLPKETEKKSPSTLSNQNNHSNLPSDDLSSDLQTLRLQQRIAALEGQLVAGREQQKSLANRINRITEKRKKEQTPPLTTTKQPEKSSTPQQETPQNSRISPPKTPQLNDKNILPTHPPKNTTAPRTTTNLTTNRITQPSAKKTPQTIQPNPQTVQPPKDPRCIQGNCFNGIGTFLEENGERYVGGWKNGLRHGKGTIHYPNGNKYVGQWKNGQKYGRGSRHLSFQDIIEKQRQEALKKDTQNAALSERELKLKEQERILSQKRRLAEKGCVLGECRTGKGIYFYNTGDEYKGVFFEGKRHGFGEYRFANGDTYTGEWQYDQKHGRGTLKLRTGKEIRGIWNRDQLITRF
ncbi:MJ0042-type zinc finger domain-containing protein [Magnetococcales bacterium HHB-1]